MNSKIQKYVFDSWGGGEIFDWWMVIHFLGGTILAFICRFIGLSFWHAFLLTFIVLVGWEVYEKLVQIEEPWINSILDLIVAIVGFILVYRYGFLFSFKSQILLAGGLFSVWLLLSLWGWISWIQRDVKAPIIAKDTSRPTDSL